MEQTEVLAKAEQAAQGVERPKNLNDPCVMQILLGLQELAHEQDPQQAQDWSRYYVDRQFGPDSSTFGPYDDFLDAVHVALQEQARLTTYRRVMDGDDCDSDCIWVRPACLESGEGVSIELEE